MARRLFKHGTPPENIADAMVTAGFAHYATHGKRPEEVAAASAIETVYKTLRGDDL
ncbi:MAG TPA: hypothetical protein VM493_07260 [Vicinamibacterales bacterium]|nr:hypothetical protein [Vicinamibacterales bacterium]